MSLGEEIFLVLRMYTHDFDVYVDGNAVSIFVRQISHRHYEELVDALEQMHGISVVDAEWPRAVSIQAYDYPASDLALQIEDAMYHD